MYNEVDGYYTFCLICQRARVIRGKQSGELQLLHISTKTWDNFSISFIIGLSESVVYRDTYETILVVVDKLSQMRHYIPCRSDIRAGRSAKAIMREVIRLNRVPSAIISDLESLFTFRLWVNIMYSSRIERQLSTAFHP